MKGIAFGEEKLVDLFVETFRVQAEDFGGVDRQRTVHKNRNAWDPSFVEQNLLTIDFKEVLGSCCGAGRAAEGEFHDVLVAWGGAAPRQASRQGAIL